MTNSSYSFYFNYQFELNYFVFKKDRLEEIKLRLDNDYPVVYIIYNPVQKLAYVGETINAYARMSQHIVDKKKSRLFNHKVIIVSSSLFNKSAALDIEEKLISFMFADKKFDLLNGNGGMRDHNYHLKDEYQNLFTKLWGELKFKDLVSSDLSKLSNDNLFKYSPYKSLSSDQKIAVYTFLKQFLLSRSGTFFIEGSSGTGKTIVAIYLIKLLNTEVIEDDYQNLDGIDLEIIQLVEKIQKKYGHLKIALVVVMTSLRETISNVFHETYGLKKNMVISPSSVLKKKYDIVFVDEAHRLRRRKGLSQYGYMDNNNKKHGFASNGNEKDGNELDWVLHASSAQVLFYDAQQSIKPADVRSEQFSSLKTRSIIENRYTELKSQMRAKGGEDYLEFVDKLWGQSLPEHSPKFNSKSYDLLIYKSFAKMKKDLEVLENQYGLVRLVSGFAWEWKSKKDKTKIDKVIDGVELQWNLVDKDWVHSTNRLDEMGCIHTVQGYDLNYTGIIIGDDIILDENTNTIVSKKENYKDPKGKFDVNSEEVLTEYIKNIYKTLMYRGIKGTYLYIVDDSLRNYFSNHIRLI